MDTCCIDKTNSTELIEALNSMYRWYSSAEKCYVYLTDVRTEEPSNEHSWQRDFRNSRWFGRGWTLQELIAPSIVEFYSSEGDFLGSKDQLEKEINEITRIPIKALRSSSFSDFSLQERRQWQKGRQTKKEEDMVYSLLGLLEVSLHATYGIGFAEAQSELNHKIAIKYKGGTELVSLSYLVLTKCSGTRFDEYSLNFSLVGTTETQNFVARESQLKTIHTTFADSDGSRKVVVLHGLGGMGKTQLAIAYAKRHKDDYSAILWVNVKDEDSVNKSFTTIAKQIIREHPNAPLLSNLDLDQAPNKATDAVKAWLSTSDNTRWLMICDNYDNPKSSGSKATNALDAGFFLPQAYQGVVLITTRSSQVQLGPRLPIIKLNDLKDSLLILETASSRQNLSNGS